LLEGFSILQSNIARNSRKEDVILNKKRKRRERMKKPKLKNFIFKKGLRSYFVHLKKYDKKEQLKEAQKILSNDHNLAQSLSTNPRYREYPKVMKVKDDGTIIYQIKKHYFRRKKRIKNEDKKL